MPVVHVHVWKGRTPDQKRKLVKAVTEAMVEHMGCKPDALHVMIQDYELEDWGRAGVLGIDRKDIPPAELDLHR